MTYFTATYSPDDNKLRLYATTRLDAETYAKVKAAGFRWAPKQDLFVAPSWTPARENLLIELAGEVEDEDKSLVERAEERAERFEDYSGARRADAESARKAVSAIADNIPFGQPILVGHHSEKHARRDAEKIDSGMRKTIKMCDTANYWSARAHGALRAAKYKELPGVRHRRIKGLESEKRKVEKNRETMVKNLAIWTVEGLTLEQARQLAGNGYFYLRTDSTEDFTAAYDVLRDDPPKWPLEKVVATLAEAWPKSIAHCDRWIAHYENRLTYERAMLDKQIGTGELGSGMGGRFDIKPGGKVLIGRNGEWLVVIRVNKAGGAVNSVTTQAPASVTWTKTWKYGIEKVADYQPPTEEMAAKVKKATKLPPLCNYPGEGFLEMTQAEWTLKMKRKWSDFPYIGVAETTETMGRHRFRQLPKPGGSMWQKVQIFLTDAKRIDPPKPEPKSEPEALPTPERRPLVRSAPPLAREVSTEIEAMRDSLKAGVKVVTAPQLFPTPPEIAARAVELAGIEPGHRVLEPSAGTGRLVDAIGSQVEVVAVERNLDLCVMLRKKTLPWVNVRCDDFLASNSDLGQFDRIVMNPPFENGADIKHIKHALGFLRPGGRLVAICANGPRQEANLRELANHWEELPSGTFAGTGVSTVLLAIDTPS